MCEGACEIAFNRGYISAHKITNEDAPETEAQSRLVNRVNVFFFFFFFWGGGARLPVIGTVLTCLTQVDSRPIGHYTHTLRVRFYTSSFVGDYPHRGVKGDVKVWLR